MKLFIATSLFAVAACATTSTGTTPSADRSSRASTGLRLDSARVSAPSRYFPKLLSPARLPGVDRKQHVLKAQAARFDARLRICVAPDGTVASVDVDKSSGVTAYDRLLAADVATWEYQSYDAPAHLKVCQRAKVTYLIR
jgi:hypothetical protein